MPWACYKGQIPNCDAPPAGMNEFRNRRCGQQVRTSIGRRTVWLGGLEEQRIAGGRHASHIEVVSFRGRLSPGLGSVGLIP